MLLAALIPIVTALQVAQVEAILQARIGSAAGSSGEAFGRIVDLAADREGNAFVLDNRADRVHVFSAFGEHLRTFGRRGGGPNELNRPIGIDVRGARVTVLNPSGHSSSYTLEGDLVASQRMPFGAQSATRVAEGRYAVRSWGGIAREDPQPIESLLLVGPEAVDTVLRVPSSDFLFRGPMANAALPTPLCRLAHFVVGANQELWVASGVEGTITEWASASGAPAPRRSVAVAPEGVPLPDSTRARILEQVPEQLKSSSGDLYVPPLLSSICGLERSDDDTLWIRLGDLGGRERWRAIDVATLRPISDFTAPEGVAISAFSEARAYGIESDDSGITRVMIYRIE
jgi:hypothetical protein